MSAFSIKAVVLLIVAWVCALVLIGLYSAPPFRILLTALLAAAMAVWSAKTAAALHLERHNLRTCVTQSENVAVLVSADGKVLACSPSAAAICSAPDVVGRPMLQCEQLLMLDLAAPAQRTFVTLPNGCEAGFRVRRTSLGSAYLLSAVQLESEREAELEPVCMPSYEESLQSSELLLARLNRMMPVLQGGGARLCIVVVQAPDAAAAQRVLVRMQDLLPPGDIAAVLEGYCCVALLAGAGREAGAELLAGLRSGRHTAHWSSIPASVFSAEECTSVEEMLARIHHRPSGEELQAA